ncbi:hypothetical protein BaRGS_00040016 [Batillaria attramentaria]|uniref:Uncharacterized protein n=1 Tax=Batillaria attramentaria TaxID=370345 RepID=A0ABD0J1D7_9CAEN
MMSTSVELTGVLLMLLVFSGIQSGSSQSTTATQATSNDNSTTTTYTANSDNGTSPNANTTQSTLVTNNGNVTSTPHNTNTMPGNNNASTTSGNTPVTGNITTPVHNTAASTTVPESSTTTQPGTDNNSSVSVTTVSTEPSVTPDNATKPTPTHMSTSTSTRGTVSASSTQTPAPTTTGTGHDTTSKPSSTTTGSHTDGEEASGGELGPGAIISICLVAIILIVCWKRKHRAEMNMQADMRSIVTFRPNDARISVHEAVLDDEVQAETDADVKDATENGQQLTTFSDATPTMREKPSPSTAYDNPIYATDPEVTMRKRSSAPEPRGSNSTDDNGKKKARLSMTSVASLAHSLTVGGSYVVLDEEQDKTSVAGAEAKAEKSDGGNAEGKTSEGDESQEGSKDPEGQKP